MQKFGCFFRQKPLSRSRKHCPQKSPSAIAQICCVSRIAIALFAIPNPTIAQVIPDLTLPSNSRVTSSGNRFAIEGGTPAGSNLFHSFEKFSLPTGTEAFFNQAGSIENIFTRVTGGEISHIDGLIRANGSANLFLLNPSGIVFGPNARLNIGGSFIGSTANHLKFADGTEFSATDPNASPLLSIQVPIGLQLGANPGAIRVEGTGHNLSVFVPQSSPINRGSAIAGLQVQPGRTLALVGGDIDIDGGSLTAEQGQIVLLGVGEGVVSLIPTFPNENKTIGGFAFGYENVQNFRDIHLRSRALVDASSGGQSFTPPAFDLNANSSFFSPPSSDFPFTENQSEVQPFDVTENLSRGGGSIEVRGGNLAIADGSVILIQNQGGQAAGRIGVTLSETLDIKGINREGTLASGLVSETVGMGNGGEIAVNTARLLIQNGGAILTRTFSDARAGNITLNAKEWVQAIAFSTINPIFASSITASTYSSGNAGNIAISTGQLRGLDGGIVGSATFGTGDGGDVSVSATDAIELSGVEPTRFTPSSVSASTFNAGNAGSLAIATGRLVVRNGGRVDSSTVATGNAGSVTIDASRAVEVSGTVPGSVNPSIIISSANLVDKTIQDLFGLPAVPSGASGDVTIATPVLSVSDGALVNVRNDGSGDAGRLRISADSIVLRDRGGITAGTTSGEGGNITLQAQDLRLSDRSAISAEAGGTGNGGNINISTETIAAFKDSNITANAFEGAGGNIAIATQGVFVSPDSAITASSQLGVDGVVQINRPDVEPSSGLVELPETVVDVAALIGRDPCAAGVGNRFVITGRGGLPPNPDDSLTSDIIWVDKRQFNSPVGTGAPSERSRDRQLVEARGWFVGADGKITLTANVPSATAQRGWLNFDRCHSSDRSPVSVYPRRGTVSSDAIANFGKDIQ